MRLRSILMGAATLCYPILVYLLLQRFDIRMLVWPLCALALLRFVLKREWLWGVALLGLAIATLVTNQSLPAKLYPVVVNASLLAVFAHSLLRPPSAVERIARIREPDLPVEAIAYTRKVTMVWCAYFLLNGSVAAWLAFAGTDKQWTLYCGGIAYVLAGVLFAGEFLVRQTLRWKKLHA
ncbi:MAG: hypothetical protein ABI645_14915 [Pseudomonadota bacterium]